MTGYELYDFIKNDPELIGMVRQGLAKVMSLRQKRGRKPDPRKKATAAFKRFWGTEEAITFRLNLERKLGPDLAVRVTRGGAARIRPVMILIVDDVLRELESQEV